MPRCVRITQRISADNSGAGECSLTMQIWRGCLSTFCSTRLCVLITIPWSWFCTSCCPCNGHTCNVQLYTSIYAICVKSNMIKHSNKLFPPKTLPPRSLLSGSFGSLLQPNCQSSEEKIFQTSVPVSV